MPSILQQQLQQVTSTWGSSTGKRQRGKPSLLYTAQEAADIDLQSLYELALEGLTQLCTVEARFEPYQNTLFSQAGLETNRDEQTKAENAAMDVSIEAYLRLLTDHFLSVAAFQTLEYMIRRYRVNECNVSALLACGLPYHATNHFVRLVQILRLEHTRWQFLSPMQKSGAAVPRALLVQRCINDQAVLKSICQAAKAVSSDRSASSSMQSFYAVLLCELLLATQPVKEELVRLLLPYLMAGLGPDITADYRAASLMILTQLASQATLSDTLITGLLQEMLHNVPSTQGAQAVMVLCHLALAQPQLKQLPKSVFKSIMKLPGLVDYLGSLANKGMALGPLLALLLPQLGSCILARKLYVKIALIMVKTLPLGIHAQQFAIAVLGKLTAATEEQKSSLTPVVRALDLHFPEQMDAAVNQLLQHSQQGEQAAKAVFKTLQKALAGSSHAPLLSSGSTLALAIDAPSAELRIAVLKELDTAFHTAVVGGDGAAMQEQAVFVQDALLRRLGDDEAAVVDTVLSLPILLHLPGPLLFSALAALLGRCKRVTGLNSNKPRHRGWKAVTRKALKLLLPSLVQSDPSLKQQAMLQLLSHSVVLGGARKVAAQAVQTLQAYNDVLFKGLADISIADEGKAEAEGAGTAGKEPGFESPDSTHDLAPTTPNRTTDSDKAADLAFNQAVVHALASQLASTHPQHSLAQAQQLFLAADSFPHARHLLLLAWLQACHLSSNPAGVAASILKAIRAKWGAVEGSGAISGAAPVAAVDDKGVPAAAHFRHWERKAAKSHAGVLQQALLAALRHAPAQELQEEMQPFLSSLLQLQPQSLFEPHCAALLDKASAPSLLLSAIFGAAALSAAQQALQVRSLTLVQPYMTAANAAEPSPVLLPRLLAAASSTSQQARTLALGCLLVGASHAEIAEHALVDAELFGGTHLQAFQLALTGHHEEITSDSLGLLQVVRRLLPDAAAKGRAFKHGHAHKAGSHALDSRHSAAVLHYMLEVLPQLHDNSSCPAASLLIHILTSSAAPGPLLQSATALLNNLPLHNKSPAAPLGGQVQLACELLALFTAEAFQALSKSRGTAAKAAKASVDAGLEVLLYLLRFGLDCASSEEQAAKALKLAAYQQLGAELYAVMPVQQQMEAFLALLNGSSRDPSHAVRQAARAALAELPLTALSLTPLLTVSDKAASAGHVDMPAPKTRRRSKAESNVKQAAQGLDILELAGELSGLNLCISVLELLQWKADVQDEAELLAPLSKVLQQLLASLHPPAATLTASSPDSMAMSDDDESSSDEDNDSELQPQPRSSHQAYSMALALQAVQHIAERATEAWLKAVDMGLVLQCARQAPDSAVRNVALTLLAVLASKLPDSALQHVLEVVAVVGSTASEQDDTHSRQVAAATLGAVAPAWLQSGKPLTELVAAVVAPLPHMLSHRRLPLLTALLAAVPQDAARPVLLLLLLQKALQLSADGPLDATKASVGSLVRQEESWPVALANSVCHQASLLVRVQSVTALMQQAASHAELQPHRPLPALATTFAATQVQGGDMASPAARSSGEVQLAYSALLEAALSQLQLLGADAGSSKQGKKAYQAAQDRLYSLLEALAQVMEGGAYIAALLRLCHHPSEAVVRRALKLITTSVSKLSLQEQSETKEGNAGASTQVVTSADAALELCAMAPTLLETGEGSKQLTASTRQAALIALSTVGQALGPSHPEPIIAALPAIVAAAKDVHRSVRGSSLAAAAACLAALGSKTLPLLPKLVPAVIAAAQAAVDGLPGSSPGSSSEESEEDDRADTESSSEAAALEAAAALTAVAALVEGLKAFLSPHLSALLHLLFSPAVLACKQANCSETAGSIRIQLAGVMPARLLLGPLFAHFDGAVQEGEAATVSLLAMAQRTIEQMDPATAAQHSDPCFTFLLRALDLRQKRPASLPALGPVEQGSVSVLLALTMKLSEAKFKPLFLRLLDWGSTPPAAQPEAKPLGRQVALFTAVLGLTERLRSVFVPYFCYLLDSIAAQLGGSLADAGKIPRKKKTKRSTSVALAVGDDASREAHVVEDTWRLRFKVVQSLHSCFLYDTVSFLDEARFHRLLPVLVSQLAAQPPPGIAAALAVQHAHSVAAPAADTAAGSDPFGQAVVAALVQMAVTANNDALWKSLNHQTLMATRSPVTEERLRATAAVDGLVGRMREEYLLLLPEALPFLAELLEDPEHQVASATQLLIRKLEELSGESLEQYLQV